MQNNWHLYGILALFRSMHEGADPRKSDLTEMLACSTQTQNLCEQLAQQWSNQLE